MLIVSSAVTVLIKLTPEESESINANRALLLVSRSALRQPQTIRRRDVINNHDFSKRGPGFMVCILTKTITLIKMGGREVCKGIEPSPQSLLSLGLRCFGGKEVR